MQREVAEPQQRGVDDPHRESPSGGVILLPNRRQFPDWQVAVPEPLPQK